jgi:hypothetical protein
LKALFHQPGGSAIARRRLSVGLVSACTLAAAFLALQAGPALDWSSFVMCLTASLALFTSPLVDRRRSPFDAQLELGPGRVAVRDHAGRTRTSLEARAILGATTARLDDGVSLVLALQPIGTTPIVLRLPDEASADDVRRALGVGPGGVGQAQWPTGPALAGVLRGFVRIGWRAALGLMVLGALQQWGTGWGVFFTFALIPLGIVALAMRLTQGNDPPRLELSRQGILGNLRGADGRWTEVRVPFGAIRSVDLKREAGAEAIVLECAPPFDRVVLPTRVTRGLRGIDAEEVAHIAAQIRGAIERARQPSLVGEQASRLEILRRGQQPWRAWLARLDALGLSLKGAHDYRAPAIDESELWSALETQEVDAELRTAAARVLAQGDPAKAIVRIESTLSAERDPAAARQIRVALESDAEVVVQELAALELRRTLQRR